MGCCCSKEPISDDESETTPLLGDKQDREQHGVGAESSRKTNSKSDAVSPRKGDSSVNAPPSSAEHKPITRPPKDTTPATVDFKPIKVERYDQHMEANVSRFHDYLNQFTKLQNCANEMSRMFPDQNTDQTIAGCFLHVRNTMGDRLADAVIVKDADPTSLWITYKAESVHHSLLPALNTFNKASRLVKELLHEGPQLAVAVDDVIFAETDMNNAIVKVTKQAEVSVRNRCLDHCLYDMQQFFRIKGMLAKIRDGTLSISSDLQVAADKIAVESEMAKEVRATVGEQVPMSVEPEVSRHADQPSTTAKSPSKASTVESAIEPNVKVETEKVQHNAGDIEIKTDSVQPDSGDATRTVSDVLISIGEVQQIDINSSSNIKSQEEVPLANVKAIMDNVTESREQGNEPEVTEPPCGHDEIEKQNVPSLCKGESSFVETVDDTHDMPNTPASSVDVEGTDDKLAQKSCMEDEELKVESEKTRHVQESEPLQESLLHQTELEVEVELATGMPEETPETHETPVETAETPVESSEAQLETSEIQVETSETTSENTEATVVEQVSSVLSDSNYIISYQPINVTDTAEEPMAAATDKAEEPMAAATDMAEEPMAAATDMAEEPMAAATDMAEEPMAAATDMAEEPMAAATDMAEEPMAAATGMAEEPMAAATDKAEEPMAAATYMAEEPIAAATDMAEEHVAVIVEKTEQSLAPDVNTNGHNDEASAETVKTGSADPPSVSIGSSNGSDNKENQHAAAKSDDITEKKTKKHKSKKSTKRQKSTD